MLAFLCRLLPTGCLKDLQRFLRNDDPDTRDAFFKVAEFDLARSDLVPIITTYPEDKELVFNARKWTRCNQQLVDRMLGSAQIALH